MLACLVGALIATLLFPALCAAAPPAPLPLDVPGGYGALDAVACPLTSQCTAVGFFGDASIFEPARERLSGRRHAERNR